MLNKPDAHEKEISEMQSKRKQPPRVLVVGMAVTLVMVNGRSTNWGCAMSPKRFPAAMVAVELDPKRVSWR